MALVARLLSISGLLALLSSCVTDAPPKTILPAGRAATRLEALSGDYCYRGPELSVRFFNAGIEEIPFVQVAALGVPAVVSVKATPREIVFRYKDPQDRDAVQRFDVAGSGARWRDGTLVVEAALKSDVAGFPWTGSRYVSGSTEARLFRIVDGPLVMSHSVRFKGYDDISSGDGFFRRERTVVVVLDPLVGGCDADPRGRPLTPWLDRGPDLREPACAANFKAQLVSILVQKDESPEVASSLVEETIRSFFDGADLRRFEVSSVSGSTYYFKVQRQSGPCVLRLVHRTRKTAHSSTSYVTFATRPLPDCACND